MQSFIDYSDIIFDAFCLHSKTKDIVDRKQEILVKILKEVTATCPKCKMEVAKRLSQITGIVEPVVIHDEQEAL